MAGSKTTYQGGPFVDILTGHGRSPLDDFKITPPTAVEKVFDNAMKGFVFNFNGGAVAKMQIPKDDKQSMNWVQPYIVFQVMIPQGQSFSIEFCISDGARSKRRIHLSSALNKPDSTPLHARIPLSFMPHGVWLNLCFDLVSLVNNNFRGQSFRSLDLITIHPSCTLRRIFTLRSPPYDTTDDPLFGTEELQGAEPIPHTHEIPAYIESFTQIFTMEKLFIYLQHQQNQQNQPPSSPPQSEASKGTVPLAFGRRVNSTKGSTSQLSISPSTPFQSPPSSYPASPQTPNTRLAAKSKLTKPNPAAALTKPITGRLPRINNPSIHPSSLPSALSRTPSASSANSATVSTSEDKRGSLKTPGSENKRIVPPRSANGNKSGNGNSPHRNITPVPHTSRIHRDNFSDIPPRSASPEMPRKDFDDDDYPDGSSYYGSDEEEFPAQNFNGVTFANNKEYQSSRYQSGDNLSAGSDRATTAMSDLNLGNQYSPHSYTSHVNTKPVNKNDQYSNLWDTSALNNANKGYSADLNQDISLESLRKSNNINHELADTRPRTTSRSNDISNISNNSINAGISTSRSISRNGAADSQRSRTPRVTSTPDPLANKASISRGQTAPGFKQNEAKDRESIHLLKKPSTSAGRTITSASTRKSNMDLLVHTVEQSELHKSGKDPSYTTQTRAHSATTRSSLSNFGDDVARPASSGAKSTLDVARRGGERRNSMEAVYNRLVAESDLPVVRGLGSSPQEEEEDDVMVTTGDGDGDGDDEDYDGGGMENQDSIELDKGLEGNGDAEEDGEVEEGEEEEIDDDVEENAYDEDNDDYGEVDEEINDSMDRNDFEVHSTQAAAVDITGSDDEVDTQIEFDSSKNAYYDAKNKKSVHLH